MKAVIRNCKNCEHILIETDFEWSCNIYYDCSDNQPKSNIKSFPFEKEQDCHVPGFWQYCDEDHELSEIFEKENADFENSRVVDLAYERFKEKYLESAAIQK